MKSEFSMNDTNEGACYMYGERHALFLTNRISYCWKKKSDDQNSSIYTTTATLANLFD